jgi:hypothetical protein
VTHRSRTEKGKRKWKHWRRCAQEKFWSCETISQRQITSIIVVPNFHAVAKLVEELCYKAEGCGLYSRLSDWNHVETGFFSGRATGYELDGRGSISSIGKFFLFPLTPIPALGLTQPYFQRLFRVIFSCAKRSGREATTHLPVPKSRMVVVSLHSAIRLHGIVLN